MKISSAHKLIYHVLTSEELGYLQTQIERPLNRFTNCDLFIPEIGLVIEINGPTHYFEVSGKTRPSLISRLMSVQHKVLTLETKDTTETVLAYRRLEIEDIDDSYLVDLKKKIKALINNKLNE